MPVIRTMFFSALLAVVIAGVAAPANAMAAYRVAAGKHGAPITPGAPQCSLPTDANHLPHPVLSARLNRDRTVTFRGRTCPGLLIGVFLVHGKRVRNLAEDLVCDAIADRRGAYSCTSLRRYPIRTKFGVVISGQSIVGLEIAGTPLSQDGPHSWHSWHSRPHGAPETGLGGMARSVGRHHVRQH